MMLLLMLEYQYDAWYSFRMLEYLDGILKTTYMDSPAKKNTLKNVIAA